MSFQVLKTDGDDTTAAYQPPASLPRPVFPIGTTSWTQAICIHPRLRYKRRDRVASLAVQVLFQDGNLPNKL